VPAGLRWPGGDQVRNASTGEVSEGASVEVVALSLEPAYAPAGTTLDVRLTLAGNAAFDPTATRVALGTGITVNRVSVEGPRA